MLMVTCGSRVCLYHCAGNDTVALIPAGASSINVTYVKRPHETGLGKQVPLNSLLTAAPSQCILCSSCNVRYVP